MNESDKSVQRDGVPVSVTTTVEAKQRLRVNAEIIAAVTWLRDAPRGDPFECLGRLGVDGQMILEPQVGTKNLNSDEFVAEFANTPAKNTDDAALIDHARASTNIWPIALSSTRKTKRRELILPKGAREIGIVPSEGEPAVIFAFGSIFEIWRADTWRERCQKFMRTQAEDEESDDRIRELVEARNNAPKK